jgi:predicted transport protein
MPLFQIHRERLTPIGQSGFLHEKELQRLVERNIEVVFRCRFVASEFSTGSMHGGRIDTLALSEDGSPVIIEYKKIESSDLITQSLYYLHWIKDHRGDFEQAVQRAQAPKAKVDWSDIRVICIAPGYKKFDLHAVEVMGANIELWTYRLFDNGSVYFEDVRQRSQAAISRTVKSGKNPVMVEAGRKAARSRLSGQYSFDQHLVGKPAHLRELAIALQEYMTGLPSIQEAPKKLYIAYRTTQNVACVEIQRQKILVFLKLDPKKHRGPAGISRDVSNKGHFGTGDLEITIRNASDLEALKPFVMQAYKAVGS